MTKRNPYLQHTYESFDQPVPQRRSSMSQQDDGIIERIFGSEWGARMRSPLFATAALLITGAAFAGIIIASYPSGDGADDNVPVVTADAGILRETPAEPGGMDVPHQDSTVYNTVRSADLQEKPPLENLLAEEQPVDTQTAFADETQAEPAEAMPPSEMADASPDVPAADASPAETEEAGAVPPVKIVETRSIPMKSEKLALAADDAGTVSTSTDSKPVAATSAKPPMAPAASSPETLEFVRSVLENKGADGTPGPIASAEPPSEEKLAAVEPAAGAAVSAGPAIKPGSTYIQLASISSESAAPKEWTKLQKQFSGLKEAEYRVQRADLGAKGVFFRIQAGPMSKDSAKSICNDIKVQKPGGCIIVQ